MRPIITFYLRRLFEGTDVQVNNIKKGTLSLRYVCKRQFSEPRNSRMAEGGHNQENTFLVVGLGNLDRPKSRHSVGMQVTDLIAKTCGTKFEKRKECQSMIASVQVNGGVTLILMKPRLPMNLNGRCVSKTVRQYNIGSENIILVHDNLDKATGVVKLKEKGGSASGHNGVKSVAASIKSGLQIPRILIGIDRPSSRDQEDVVEYVLEDFPKDEQSVIKGAVQKSVKVLGEVILKRTEIDILSELQETDRNNNKVT